MNNREAFESWWQQSHNGQPPRHGWAYWRTINGYRETEDSDLQEKWEVWCAARAALMPVQPVPAALYALWAHREDMRGSSENEISDLAYTRLRQYLFGEAPPQNEWSRPSK